MRETGSRGWAAVIGVCTTVVACSLAFASVAGAAAGAPNSSPTRYYVALGDSLATAGGATPGHGYVDDVFASAKRSIPGLSLKNLACGGDSTTRMINGGLCHNYTTGNQLGDAKAFLSTHRGQVAFVTIDIGGDDIGGCFSGSSINVPCFEAGVQRMKTNLRQILVQLRSAGGAVPFLGMTYYDPYLAYWLEGAASGHALARQSLRLVIQANGALRRIYRRYGLRIVDGQRAFHTSNFRRHVSFAGQTLPLNVDLICQWTHMCTFGADISNALMHNGRHANDTGYGVLASAFERVLTTLRLPRA
jgi:lysophospholipase L1-like esterase